MAVGGIPQTHTDIFEESLSFDTHSNPPGLATFGFYCSAMKNAHPVGRKILFGGVGVQPQEESQRSQPLSCSSRLCSTW